MKSIYTAVLYLFTICLAFAQDDLMTTEIGSMVELKVRKGSRFIGQYQGVKDSFYAVNITPHGEVLFRAKEVQYIKALPSQYFSNGVYWPRLHSSHYYYAVPTAFTPPKRSFVYRNDWLLYNQLTYGISNHISLGIALDGALFFRLFSEDINDGLFFALSPKIAIPQKILPSVKVAVGSFLVNVPPDALDTGVEDAVFDAAVTYGIGTLGNEHRNLSIGFGYSYLNRNWSGRPAAMLGGSVRANRWLALVAEVWNFPQYDASIGNIGVKLIGKRGTFQIAIPAGRLQQNSQIVAFPFLSYATSFGF
jgi:hypothetical protein